MDLLVILWYWFQLIITVRIHIRVSFIGTFLERCCSWFRCFYVVFRLIWHRNIRQPQINVETRLCMSTLEFTTSNIVESTLFISNLIWTTLDNVKITLLFSASSFTTLWIFLCMVWPWLVFCRGDEVGNKFFLQK